MMWFMWATVSVNLNNRISPTLDKSALKDKMLWSRTVLRYYEVNFHCKCEMTMSNQKYFECTDGLALSKADAVLEREENFYRVFSIVKYSYLSRNTFKTFVVMHVTSRKLTF